VAQLQLKVVPGASRDEITGWLGEALKVKVSAPPEKGKANRAVLKLLAKLLGVSKSSITIVSGETSQQKVLEIELDTNALRKRLEEAMK